MSEFNLKTKWRMGLISVFMLLVISGCGGGGTEEGKVPVAEVKTISISLVNTQELVTGSAIQLSATLNIVNGSSSNISDKVSWSTSDSKIASISASGLLTANSPGSAVISAAFDGLNAQLPVTVKLANQSAQIAGTPSVASIGLPFSFMPTVTDHEGDVVTLSLEKAPAWLTLDPQQKQLSGVPQAADLGGNEVILQANDGRNTTKATFIIEVDTGERYDTINAQDFYAVDSANKPRALINHLKGVFAAHVQFVQSHSIQASENVKRDTGNELNSRYMPDLVPERSALMLVMPEQDITSLTAVISIKGEEKLRLSMKHPNSLLRSDYNAKDGRDDLIYSTKAWSAEIPWQFMRPGIAIAFVANERKASEQKGELTIFEFAAPTELVLRSIRLGMLTEPPVSNGHHMLINTAKAGTDYFQTIPVAKLTLVNYQPMKLDKVIIANGTIYDKVSQSEGSVYSGDMRENVAKAQVSTGINLANVGITSNNMAQSYPHVFKQITIHHAVGNYTNGVQEHGLSGGNGIATLYDSIGNELSHELGHAYGLGHYPGANLSADRKWAAHHADSGWGYIAHRQRMRANVHWHWAASGAEIDGLISPYTYKDLYSYNRDAMSGGENPTLAELSGYTHHTGYSAQLIQKNLDMPIPDLSFPSGYKKWDAKNLSFVNHPDLGDARILKPAKIGVQVTTILGGYDPDSDVALIYPTFEGNYGNIFDLPEPAATGNTCWLEVNNANGELKKVALASTRHNRNTINQLHLNLPASYLPTVAELYCRQDNNTRLLTRQQFKGSRTAMADAVIIGKEHGFDALKAEEMPWISDELAKLVSDETPIASPTLAILLASYSQQTLMANIGSAAQKVLMLMQANDAKVQNVSRLIARVLLHGSQAQDRKQAIQWLQQEQLLTSDNKLPLKQSLLKRSTAAICITSELVDGKVTINAECSANNKQLQWFMDARGAIHPTTQPDKCLMPGNADSLVLSDCSATQNTQRWLYDAGRLKNFVSNKCIDHGRGTVIMYSCHMSSNQQWQKPEASNHLLLTLLHGVKLRALQLMLNE
jgi:hypothetical protein